MSNESESIERFTWYTVEYLRLLEEVPLGIKNERVMRVSDHERIVKELEARASAIAEVAQCAQAVLTALNVGDVQNESPLHRKLREVMIAYRERLKSLSTQT